MWRMNRAAGSIPAEHCRLTEGQRTMEWRVGPFQRRGVRMALQSETPIVPSGVGSLIQLRKTSWLIRPALSRVNLHAVIATKDLRKEGRFSALRDRLHCNHRHHESDGSRSQKIRSRFFRIGINNCNPTPYSQSEPQTRIGDPIIRRFSYERSPQIGAGCVFRSHVSGAERRMAFDSLEAGYCFARAWQIES